MSEKTYSQELEPNQDSMLTLRGGHADEFLDAAGYLGIVKDFSYLANPDATPGPLTTFSARTLQGNEPRRLELQKFQQLAAEDPHYQLQEDTYGTNVYYVLSPEEKTAVLQNLQESDLFTFSLGDMDEGKKEPILNFSEKNIDRVIDYDVSDTDLMKGEKPFEDSLSMTLIDLAGQEFLNNLNILSNKFNLLPRAFSTGRTDRVPAIMEEAAGSLMLARTGLESLAGLVAVYDAAYADQKDPGTLGFLTSLYPEVIEHFTKTSVDDLSSFEAVTGLIHAVQDQVVQLNDPKVLEQYAEIQQSIGTITEGYTFFVDWVKKLEKPDHSDQIKPWLVGSNTYLKQYVDALSDGPSITELAATPATSEQLADKIHYIDQLFQVFMLFRNYFSNLLISSYNPLDLPDFNQEFLEQANLIRQVVEGSADLYQGLTELPSFVPIRDKQTADWQEFTYLADAFFHDVGGVISNLGGVASLEYDKPGTIASNPQFGEILENGLQQLRKILESFDFREGKVSSIPESLDNLKTYLEKLIGRSEKLNVQLHLTGAENVDLSQIESQLNVPLLLRLLNNAEQNTDKAYKVIEETYGITIPKEERALAVWLDVQLDHVSLVFQDRGFGFLGKDALSKPISQEDEKQVRRSTLDQVPYVPYEPQKGKSVWSDTVKGTGTGLAGLKQNIVEQLGGEFVSGTVINEEQQPAGARLEIVFPIKPVDTPPQT